MSQATNGLAIPNEPGANFRADVNSGLQQLATFASGATAPSTTYPYQFWADTANTLLKQRNGANNAWLTIGTLDTTNLGLAPLTNAVYNGSSAPGSPVAYQLWHDTTNKLIKIRSADNTTWITLFTLDETGYTAVAPSSVSSAGGFRNKIRNGNFNVWQRGTSVTINSGTSGYTADGFIVSATGANAVCQQNGSGFNGSTSALVINTATGLTNVSVKQRIESSDCGALASQICTAQVSVFQNTGSSITPTLTIKHATAADNWGATVTDVSAVSLQSVPSGTWTTLAYTFTASGNSTNGVEMTLDFGGAGNISAKVIDTTSWDLSATPGVALGLNNSPPPPELRPLSVELPMNKRYYQTLGGKTTSDFLGMGFSFSTTQCTIVIGQLPVEMRASPTIATGTASNYTINGNGISNAASAISVASGGAADGQLALTVTAATVTADRPYSLRTNSTSGQITLTAEL